MKPMITKKTMLSMIVIWIVPNIFAKRIQISHKAANLVRGNENSPIFCLLVSVKFLEDDIAKSHFNVKPR